MVMVTWMQGEKECQLMNEQDICMLPLDQKVFSIQIDIFLIVSCLISQGIDPKTNPWLYIFHRYVGVPRVVSHASSQLCMHWWSSVVKLPTARRRA